jgi:Flp pilus assembly protein CpaB
MRTGLDALTVTLVGAGAVLLAAALVGVLVLVRPAPAALPETVLPTKTVSPPGTVTTVLRVDASGGAAAAVQPGDRVDVLGYFPRQVTGTESVTRLVLSDVDVLAVGREGSTVGLTLAVSQSTALLLHEAQALGARPFVVLRTSASAPTFPTTMTDSDLAARLAGAVGGQVTASGD